MTLTNYVKIHSLTSLFCLSLMITSLFWTKHEQNLAQDERLNAAFVENETRHLLQLLTDKETGQRGYLLTRDSIFLQPYNEATYQVSVVINRLKNSITKDQFDNLSRLIEQRQTYFLKTFELTREPDDGYQQAISLVKTGAGKAFMDEMRIIVHSINQDALARSDLAKERFELIKIWVDLLFFGLIIIILVIGITPILWIRKRLVLPISSLTDQLRDLPKERQVDKLSTAGAISEIETLSNTVKQTLEELLNFEQKLSETVIDLEHTKAAQYINLTRTRHQMQGPARALFKLLDQDLSKDQIPKTLELARQYSEKLLTATNDLGIASSSAVEKIATVNSIEPVKLSSLIQNVISTVKTISVKHNIHLKFDPNAVDSNVYQTNKISLQQILINLIKNAIMHSAGTEVHVCVETKQLCELKARVTIHVNDDGIGIPKPLQDKIFTAFALTDDTRGGDGLGLSIAKSLALQLQEGHLSYHDNPSGGAAFSLSFTVENRSLEEIAGSGSMLDIQGMKIFIVEESHTLRRLSQLLLERSGVVVQTASNSSKALERLNTFDADVVLASASMAHNDGVSLTESLRENGFNKPIIGVADLHASEQAAAIVECGADYVITKPIKSNAVAAALKIILDRKIRDLS